MGGGLKKRTGLEKKGGGVEKKWIPKKKGTCWQSLKQCFKQKHIKQNEYNILYIYINNYKYVLAISPINKTLIKPFFSGILGRFCAPITTFWG